MNRRQLIGRLAAAGFSAPVIASILADPAFAQDATPSASPAENELLAELGKDQSLIQHGTTTFEMPMAGMDDFITPNDKFFVRSNGPAVVEIDPAEWSLKITGLVNEEIELSLDDLKAMGSRTITAWLECSGNSRGRFGDDPQTVEGTQWGNGAIGNVEWTGVSLADILDKAGVKEGAVDVVSQGGDFEDMQRGLPIEVAYDPDVMVVWEMNGEDLPMPNGGPVRLLVPGWGGIASTKWLVGLDVIDKPFEGHYNVESYVYVSPEGTVLRPVRELGPKSVITVPAPNANVDAGMQTVSGFAWSGWGGITKVEFSADGGANWEEATITQEAGPTSWVRFEYDWEAVPGNHTLRSRATDARGLQQPLYDEVDWNARGYGMNAIYEVEIVAK
jgi:DMSO/TMAO reductase YedYZ molybdopterin-dependent catalytic subunit